MAARAGNVLWRLRRFLRWLRALTSADRYLDFYCVDWTLEMMDWPPVGHQCYPKRGTVFHYRARAYHFWHCGTGYGRTAMEAAKRAVTNMNTKGSRMKTPAPVDF